MAYTTTACIDSYLTTHGKLPPSLSDTFYLLEGHRRGMGYIFTLMMYACIAFIIVPWIACTPDDFQPLPFFSIVGLGLVASAPFFKDDRIYNEVHVSGAAIAACIAAIWGIVIMGKWEAWLIITILIAMAAIGTGSAKYAWIFWCEMVAFLGVYVTMFDFYL